MDDHKIEVGVFPGAAEAVKELAKPVYEDMLKPGATQVGQSLGTAGSLVNAALMPVRLLVFGVEQIEPILRDGIESRIKNWKIATEEIQTPPPNALVPAVEALRYCASIAELREMFLNLITSAMVSSRAVTVHPSFVEIIKQLHPDEGRILTLFLTQKALSYWSFEAKWHRQPPGQAGYYESGPTFVRLSLIGKDAECVHPEKVPAYIDNLLRLGLVYEPRPWASHAEGVKSLRDSRPDRSNPEYYHSGKRISELVDLHPELEEVAASFVQEDHSKNHFEIWVSELRLTEYGKAFCLSCIASEDPEGFLRFGARDERLIHNRIRV